MSAGSTLAGLVFLGPTSSKVSEVKRWLPGHVVKT